jgi:acetyl esterase
MSPTSSTTPSRRADVDDALSLEKLGSFASMPVDTDVANLLRLLESRGGTPLAEGTVEQARQQFDSLTIGTRRPEYTPQVGSVEDIADAPVPVRIYRPEGDAASTAVIYFHGGGFVIGSVETHDLQARALCRATKAVVASADYRLAPEHPWPEAVDDCVAVTEWGLGRFGDVAVAGDSAGGNLAAVVAQELRDRVAAQLLVYPAIDLSEDNEARYPSRTENADGYFLTLDDMRFFEHHYVGAVRDRHDPRVSPLYGDLTELPPAIVVTAEYDPLRDEGEAYAEAMRVAGVRVEHRRYGGLIHGFVGFGAVVPSAARASEEMYELLGKFL